MEKYWEISGIKINEKKVSKGFIEDELINKGIKTKLKIEKLRMSFRKVEIESLKEKPDINKHSDELAQLRRIREKQEQFDKTPRRLFELLSSSVSLPQANFYKKILENRKKLTLQ